MDRNEFIDLLTEELSEDPDNNRLNRILEAADEYAKNEKAQLSCEGTTKDAISRQQALDIFDDYNVSVEYGELEAYSRDRKRLCELPTIQPEPPIIKCKDCKWWRKQKDSAQGRCRLLGIYPTGAWYCGNAERRTE